MKLPLLLMAIAAPLGSFDVIYYHLWKFRLHRQPGARAETVTHLVRGALFAGGAWMIATHRLSGAWFWAVGALFVLDFLNNVADVLLEPRSRAPLGGVPPLEYLIHVVGATFAGAITVAYFAAGWSDRLGPTALLPSEVPVWLAWQGRALAIGAALLTVLELTLMLRAMLPERERVTA
jgi:hypothetical protein